MARVPGSLRAAGQVSIMIDKPTRTQLKKLAGDMPVSHYVRGIAFGTIKPPASDPQVPAPGLEREISENTLPAISSKLDAVGVKMDAFIKFVCSGEFDNAFLRALGFPEEFIAGEKRIVIREEIRQLIEKARSLKARSMPGIDSSTQGELELA